MSYNCPTTETTFVLFINEALYFGDKLPYFGDKLPFSLLSSKQQKLQVGLTCCRGTHDIKD
jgi:hypothetical protein